MPPDEEPRGGIDEVDRMMLNSIKELSVRLGKAVAEVGENTTNQLARFREDTHRAIMGVQRRQVEFEVRLDSDDRARGTRQQQLDAVLEHLNTILDSIRRHQRVRMVIEVAVIVAVVAYYLGSR